MEDDSGDDTGPHVKHPQTINGAHETELRFKPD
jgi:hypothetical protein